MSDFSRMLPLVGDEGFSKLKNAKVIVFGVGGVGSFVCETLARAGIGNITLVDNDVVDASNINRQLVALNSTVGMPKVEVMKSRILDINPDCIIQAKQIFYDEENNFPLEYDYIVDAIDSVKSKLFLVEQAQAANVPIICSMGTGNKLEPQKLTVTDISKTSVCPLAKKMRVELRKRGISHLKVVYSTEEPKVRQVPPSSISFVPSTAGILIASEVVKDILK